jgi:uncharacterized protein (TIGR04255 family)
MVDEKRNDPVFDNPPVIETVLGVQFAPLKDLTSAHAGLFWKTQLDSMWERFNETVALPDEFERFEPTVFGTPQIKIGPVRFPGRSQISHADGGRMIQIQTSRFHYNWNRVGGEYPHYRQVFEEFERHFATFCRFVADAKLGEVVPNQWELTYIDSIEQGSLWTSPADWHEVLPGLFSPLSQVGSVRMESFGGEWHFEITPRRGRLHLSVQLATIEKNPTPVLLFQSTARGPIGTDGAPNVKEGLEIGHQAAVDLFLGITSDKAQKSWGRKS